jgi:hypothetical protein
MASSSSNLPELRDRVKGLVEQPNAYQLEIVQSILEQETQQAGWWNDTELLADMEQEVKDWEDGKLKTVSVEVLMHGGLQVIEKVQAAQNGVSSLNIAKCENQF